MHPVHNMSEATRSVINIIIAEANLTQTDFASRLRGTMGASTVCRLLNTAQELTSFHIHALLGAAARIARVPAPRLAMVMRSPFNPTLLPEFELTVAT